MAGKKSPFPMAMTPQQMGMLKKMLEHPYTRDKLFSDDRFEELAIMHNEAIMSAPDYDRDHLAAAHRLQYDTGTLPEQPDMVERSGISFTDLFDNTISGVNAPQLGDTLSASASANSQAQSNVIVAQPSAPANLQGQARASTTTRAAAISQASNASATTPFSMSGREMNAFAHHGSQAAVHAQRLGHGGSASAYDVPNHPLAGATFGHGQSMGYSHIDPSRPETMHPGYRTPASNSSYAGPVAANMQMVPYRPPSFNPHNMRSGNPGYAGPVDSSTMGTMSGQYNPGYAGPVYSNTTRSGPIGNQLALYDPHFAAQQQGKAPFAPQAPETPNPFPGQYQGEHLNRNTEALQNLHRVMTDFVNKVTSGASSDDLAAMGQNLSGMGGKIGTSPLFNQFISENTDPFGGAALYGGGYNRNTGQPTLATQAQQATLIQTQLASHYRQAAGARQAAIDAAAEPVVPGISFGSAAGTAAANLMGSGNDTASRAFSASRAMRTRALSQGGPNAAMLGRAGAAGMIASGAVKIAKGYADMYMKQPVLGASLLGGDPMTSVFNNFSGIASLRQGQIDREVAESPITSLGGYTRVFDRMENQKQAVKDYQSQKLAAIGSLSNFAAGRTVTQMVGMRPGTGGYHAARFSAFERRAEEARQLEFPAFQLTGMMGYYNERAYGGKSALGTKLGGQLQLFADNMGLGPAAAMGQMYDSLSMQGFRTNFDVGTSPVGGTQVGAMHPRLGHTGNTGAISGQSYYGYGQVSVNRRGATMEDLLGYQSAGLSPTQIGLAFRSQMNSSNLNAIGLGGQQLLNQTIAQNLTGQGATDYVQSALQMGSTYTSLGYNLGSRRTRRLPVVDMTQDVADMTEEQLNLASSYANRTSLPASGRSSRVLGEIGALQRSNQGAFAGQNAFGAYARMDLKMGKGGSRSMASQLFGGIAEQLHFASYIQQGYGVGAALDQMSFDTPGQTNRRVRGMMPGMPEDIAGALLRGGYDLTPEEKDIVKRMVGGRGPEEGARPGIPDSQNFQTRIPKAQADLGRILDFFEGKNVEGKTFIDINKRLVEANRKLEQTMASGIRIDGMEDMVAEMFNLGEAMRELYESNRTNNLYGGNNNFTASGQFGLLGNFIMELFKSLFSMNMAPGQYNTGSYNNSSAPAAPNFGQPRY
jgi:hypothetical protein